ncbi:T9SS type A sorting domain-containing protein [Flavobacterium sp.]|uniref:T9SS type A sorting domain-containing protein n=1 Tax=Flavobacterium sp. TaxID=239 RepID=UPI0037C03479
MKFIDIKGRVLEDINGNESSFQFDLSNYRNGTYLVKVITERGSKVVKIFKNLILV